MKDTLLFILKHLVDNPDDVTVEENETEGKIILTVHAHKDDMGKIIGKNGRIIRALRDLIKLIATKKRVYADVVLHEE